MLKLINGSQAVPIDTDDFYIREKSDGLDELIFNISIYAPVYQQIIEEAVVEYEQPYLVKAIDAGPDTAKIKCQIDLDALKTTLTVGYTNGSNTLANTISNAIPGGWVMQSYGTLPTNRQTIEGDYTPYDIIMASVDAWEVYVRFDVANKQVEIYADDAFQPSGAFASRQLNLKEINYKGKSTDFFTRLYAVGKDGLTFSSINGGLPYVDNHQYSDRVICRYWEDDRYTNAQSLLDAAKEMVAEGSKPSRSYSCNVYDLAETNPDMYGFQDFSMFHVVRLIDDVKGFSTDYMVVEYERHPMYPAQNVVTLSSTAPKIQNTVKSLQYEIENPQSSFRLLMQNAINAATDWITGTTGGYVVIHRDAEGRPYELLVMDTPDISTAQDVWRFNLGGFGHSSTGYNGPYSTAITQGGAIVANFITVGTMLFNMLQGGTLTLGGAANGNGVMQVLDSSGHNVVDITNRYARFQSSGSERDIYLTNGFLYTRQNGEVTGYLGAFYWAEDPTLEGTTLLTTKTYLGIGHGSNSSYTSDIIINNGLNPYNYTERIIFADIARAANGLDIGRQSGNLSGTVNGNVGITPGLYVYGDIGCSGAKNRVVPDGDGKERKYYCYETASPFFGDIGGGELDETGRCVVAIDKTIRETVGAEYYVFLQPESPGSFYVAEKSADFFIVSGPAGGRFAWELKARQSGYEAERLEENAKYPDMSGPNYFDLYYTQLGKTLSGKENLYERFN